MKKVLFTVLMIFFFIGHIYASNYSCELEGDEIIYSNSDKSSYINVKINNIEELSSFRMYIKYDNKRYSANKCQFLNYAMPACSLRTNDQSLIFYDYNYNKDYLLNDFPFFYANFISNNKTPSTGETTITVYFEDAKDKKNKQTSIDTCNKTLLFKEGNGKEEISNDGLNIKIQGFEFDFDENTYEYNLYVDSNINDLDINVTTPENYKSTINGASDLNTFGDKVIISITDPNEETKEYTINVIREKAQIVPTDIKKEVKNTIKDFKRYLPSIIVVLIILFIILIIAHKKDNKKMDKYLDNL